MPRSPRPRQLAVSYETRNGQEFTVIQGNVDGNAAADFKIEIAGHQNLGSTSRSSLTTLCRNGRPSFRSGQISVPRT